MQNGFDFSEGRVGSVGQGGQPVEFNMGNGKAEIMAPRWIKTFSNIMTHLKVEENGILNCGGDSSKLCHKQFFGTSVVVDQNNPKKYNLKGGADSLVMGGIFVTPGQLDAGGFFHQPEFYNGQRWTDEVAIGEKYSQTLNIRRQHCQVTISPTEVMILGGRTNGGNGKQNEVEKFDFKTNTWTLLAPLSDSQTQYVQ